LSPNGIGESGQLRTIEERGFAVVDYRNPSGVEFASRGGQSDVDRNSRTCPLGLRNDFCGVLQVGVNHANPHKIRPGNVLQSGNAIECSRVWVDIERALAQSVTDDDELRGRSSRSADKTDIDTVPRQVSP